MSLSGCVAGAGRTATARAREQGPRASPASGGDETMPAAARRLALLSTHLGASTAEHQQLDNPLVAVPTGLLKGLDPILTAELLYVLRMAGHGDVISIVDCNFPAAEVASKTFYGKVCGQHTTRSVLPCWLAS